MHELSLIASLIKMIEDKAETDRFTKVKSVYLKVGALSCVSADALDFAFNSLKENNFLLSSARLFIEEESGKAVCSVCGKAQEISALGQKCIYCGNYGLRSESGNNVYIDKIIVEGEQ